MSELLAQLGLSELMTPERMASLIRAAVVLVIGLVVARIIIGLLRRTLDGRLRKQHVLLVSRVAYITLLVLVASAVLNQLGFRLTVVLGAAGVLWVALGFAAQTAASNIISGAFLIAE